ncbi:MAG: type II toxin-antitoxin system RelE/ParE family toxin [Cyanobacteria bacterium]|nr:type II toxin-antitoxin system RelE/ParE family toxin [Cyanobacteria bacterium CG_2015-16_32_12]NCO79484.1 type II toxin-antitoxin system RelE/ParE family toxin [Cyanobacteria bacterium CG_2015-22_32_23]NCQ05579.1 type II toxin-antitoxin system RelE/ParE family toxin [Cyanobacteria bacterium CG_2015-09_32_10]NCQ42940.1 type II toxin-antitoxin system RelE/ParE family toxin [Cyanobacteria bacterium CG_2015-04_32_10]NCS83998.1 type II toxin-antitoxin system RelE/ParE family toxin [Cyanobacteria
MSEYKIEFLKTAKKELAKLPINIQQRISKKIESLKFNPYPADVKQLKNSNGILRIRVADYRIIYRLENDVLVIVVIKIAHSSKVYKDL